MDVGRRKALLGKMCVDRCLTNKGIPPVNTIIFPYYSVVKCEYHMTDLTK